MQIPTLALSSSFITGFHGLVTISKPASSLAHVTLPLGQGEESLTRVCRALSTVTGPETVHRKPQYNTCRQLLA